MLWKDSFFVVTPILTHCQIIDFSFKSDSFDGFVLAFYGSPNYIARCELWSKLPSIAPSTSNKPWVAAGDFDPCCVSRIKEVGVQFLELLFLNLLLVSLIMARMN